jgi:chloramphenicol-sensitive protein RarD
MTLPALVYLVYLEAVGTGSFGHATVTTNVLLGFSGVATALPLIMFAYGAKRITLATVGILQYFAPTGQFLLGVMVYGEAFEGARVAGFLAIWVALLIYSLEGFLAGKRAGTVGPSVG